MASLEESLLPPKERLVLCLARLYKHCLTTTTGGNLSLVDEDGVLYITPSGGDKAIVPPSDVAMCNSNMDMFEGPRRPSIETPMHAEIYKSKPSCRAVLHAHSMALIALSLVREMGSIASRAYHSYSDAADCHPGAPGKYQKNFAVDI